MPRFSVIVPAYRVQAYLHACLDSVLNQSFKDYEIIVVDDCSPDACGPIADEYAARDPRVSAVHLPHNSGLGPARNAGVARAAGDYLLFLDGDDTFTPKRCRPSPTVWRPPVGPTSWSTTTPVRTGRARANATPSPITSRRPAPPPSGSRNGPSSSRS